MRQDWLGVFGGTFDPVHHGHLLAAWEMSTILDLEMRIIPCQQPPHRDTPSASAEQRLHMLRIALQGQNRLVADDRELRRAGPSYTVDTLRNLRAQYPDRSLLLLVGQDVFSGLHRWHAWQELFDLTHIVVVARGVPSPLAPELDARLSGRFVDDSVALEGHRAGLVLPLPVTRLEISATKVRKAIETGNSARYLTPEPVASFIEREGLYK